MKDEQRLIAQAKDGISGREIREIREIRAIGGVLAVYFSAESFLLTSHGPNQPSGSERVP